MPSSLPAIVAAFHMSITTSSVKSTLLSQDWTLPQILVQQGAPCKRIRFLGPRWGACVPKGVIFWTAAAVWPVVLPLLEDNQPALVAWPLMDTMLLVLAASIASMLLVQSLRRARTVACVQPTTIGIPSTEPATAILGVIFMEDRLLLAPTARPLRMLIKLLLRMAAPVSRAIFGMQHQKLANVILRTCSVLVVPLCLFW
jgi:hypothetical protein